MSYIIYYKYSSISRWISSLPADWRSTLLPLTVYVMLPNLKDFICLMTYSLPFSYNDFTNSIWTTCWPSVRNRSALRLEGLPSIDCIDFGIRNSQNHKWQSTSLHDDFVANSPALSKTAMTILLDLPHGSKRNGMISTSSRRSKLQSSPILWCSQRT